MGVLALQQQQWQWRGPSSPSSIVPLPSSSTRFSLFPSSHLRFHRNAPQCFSQAADSNGSSSAKDCRNPAQRFLPPETNGISTAEVNFSDRICERLRSGLLPTFPQGLRIGTTPLSSNLKVLHLLPLLLLGLGAFFALQLPALADLGRHGSTSAILQEARVSEIVTSGWAGLMAGCLHTLTGPDHLAALAPLCIGRAKLESAIVGALWGCGHDAGQIIFGLFFLLLKGRLKIELLQVWASRVVGVTLLAIGAVGLKEAQEVPVAVLATEGPRSPEVVENKKTTHRLRTFATGIVYGLQPDALIVILPALALPSRLAGASYLGMFLLGTVVAMGSYTAFIGSCGQALQSRLPWITRRLTIGSSLVAIVFGLGVLLGELFGINFFH